MKFLLLSAAIALMAVTAQADEPELSPYPCPLIHCPDDADIPDECRQDDYIFNNEHGIKCRVCDINNCTQEVVAVSKRSDDPPMCPEVICLAIAIPDECRQVNYVTRRDGITQCRGCDTDNCAEPPLFSKRSVRRPVCPQIGCPYIYIRPECVKPNFVTGLDGKTQCRVCDSNKCTDGPLFSKRSIRSQVCPAIMCPAIYISPQCRKSNFIIGLDGKTKCRVCDSNKCTDGQLFSKR